MRRRRDLLAAAQDDVDGVGDGVENVVDPPANDDGVSFGSHLNVMRRSGERLGCTPDGGVGKTQMGGDMCSDGPRLEHCGRGHRDPRGGRDREEYARPLARGWPSPSKAASTTTASRASRVLLRLATTADMNSRPPCCATPVATTSSLGCSRSGASTSAVTSSAPDSDPPQPPELRPIEPGQRPSAARGDRLSASSGTDVPSTSRPQPCRKRTARIARRNGYMKRDRVTTRTAG